MEIVAAGAVGLLFGAGIYLLLRRDVFTLFVGLVLLTHAVNLLLFVAGGLERGRPPLLPSEQPLETLADPVPQALILTAIVIGLGVQAFLLVLVYRLVRAARLRDLGRLRATEPGDPGEAG